MTLTEWVASDDTGVSSLKIFETATGVKCNTHYSCTRPYDGSDFGRCLRLLQHFPWMRHVLPTVAEKHPEWKPIVDNWQELERLYRADQKSDTHLVDDRIRELCSGKVSE